jgi:hypothetical protein
LLAAAGLVLAEPSERRRIRYRVNAAPMVIAQSYLAALTRDWDGKLARLQRSLGARLSSPRPLLRTRQYRGLDPMSQSMAESWHNSAAKALERELSAFVAAEPVRA